MSEVTHDLGAKYLVDPYLNWAKAEGVPIAEGATLALLTLETKLWRERRHLPRGGPLRFPVRLPVRACARAKFGAHAASL